MKIIRVIGWEKFQHYKDRNPPWIKLHRELLTSNTWVTLDDASRVLAIACMLLAAATGNKIPADPAYLQRVAYLNAKPDLAPLEAVGFIEIVEEISQTASTALADASKAQANARPEQSRGRADTEQSRADARAPDFDPRYEEVRAECERILDNPNCLVWGRVNAWLAQGADPKADIYPTLTRLKAKWRGVKLEFFDGAIADSVASRTNPLPAGTPKRKQADGDELLADPADIWPQRILGLRDHGLWLGAWGPKPWERGTLLPAAVASDMADAIEAAKTKDAA